MGDLIPLRKGKAATKQAVSFAELAQPFLDRGIPVFPVQRNEKRPFLETAGFHDATTNKKTDSHMGQRQEIPGCKYRDSYRREGRVCGHRS